MTEAIKYNRYEAETLLKLTKSDEYKLEKILDVYKQYGTKHFYFNLLNTVRFPEKINSKTYDVHVCLAEELWTTISWKYYKRIDLWWLIAAMNNIDNTFLPLESGKKLMVPKPLTLRKIIDQIHNLR